MFGGCARVPGFGLDLQSALFRPVAGNDDLTSLGAPVALSGSTVDGLGFFIPGNSDPGSDNSTGQVAFSTLTVSAIPEPSALALLGLGGLALALLLRRR